MSFKPLSHVFNNGIKEFNRTLPARSFALRLMMAPSRFVATHWYEVWCTLRSKSFSRNGGKNSVPLDSTYRRLVLFPSVVCGLLARRQLIFGGGFPATLHRRKADWVCANCVSAGSSTKPSFQGSENCKNTKTFFLNHIIIFLTSDFCTANMYLIGTDRFPFTSF